MQPMPVNRRAGLDRLRWRGPWVQQEYQRNDVVLDAGAGTYWTMVANKVTTDRAGPQADNDEQYTAPDEPAWATGTHVGVVESGMEFSNPAAPILIIGFEVWVPRVTPDIIYRIRVYSYTEPDQSDLIIREVGATLLAENAWAPVKIARVLLSPGTTFGVIVAALNSASDTVVGPFEWVREGNSNNGDPSTGNWLRRNQNDVVRIHKVDNQGVNRGADGDGSLDAVIAGSTIQIVNQANGAQSATYTVTDASAYNGTVYEFPVALESNGPSGEPPVGSTTDITFTVPVPSPTEYVEEAPNPNPLGTGFLEFDGVLQPGSDANLYGVRFLYDTLTASEDWDVMSWTGTGGTLG